MGVSFNWITDSIAGEAPVVPPDRPAFALEDQPPLTYAQLHEAQLRYATALRNAGVGRGDRVGILMRNSVEYVILLFAIARVGAISVRPNWRLTAPELHFQLTDAGVGLLILDDVFTDRIEAIRDDVPVEVFVVRGEGNIPGWARRLSDFAATEIGGDFPEMGLDDPLTLMYTSGTTGRPKGCVLTHGNVLWIAAMQVMKFKFDTNTVALAAGPMFHAGGFEVHSLPALLAHGTAISLSSGGFSLDRLLEVARSQKVTSMLAYSFAVYDLARRDDLASVVPDSLGHILVGGDIVMPWVYTELGKQLPRVRITQTYSLTEAGTVGTMLDHEDAPGRERSVGKPLPLAEVKVVDPAGNRLPPGEVGEICLRNPGVSGQYWNRPEASAETFTDGWCRTGDLGVLDGEGFLTLSGRAKDMIRSGGENVYPAEVEKVLTGHPAVGYAALVGVPDAKFVEVGCAVLEPHPGASIDVDELRAFAATKLAKFKVPKHFIVVDELPRNASGKVQKFLLREEFAHLGTDASAR